MKEAHKCAFVLVAGGLGERLGYNGIKIALPVETTTLTCYLAWYCGQISSIQQKSGSSTPLPLIIMVSEDTADRTHALLEEHAFFGLLSSQVFCVKQGLVPALLNNDGHIAKSSVYHIMAKPHGHGDVHSLLHHAEYTDPTETKAPIPLLSHLAESGIEWLLFIQDTNALGLFALPIMLGNSVSNRLDMNSMCVPRKAKQAVGALIHLTSSNGSSSADTGCGSAVSNSKMVINVEYNMLDALLRSSGQDGDANDPSTQHSPYPGNINMLLLKLSSYRSVLSVTGGAINEFVNPKYADQERNVFKKPTRLECMMQDIAKSFCSLPRPEGEQLSVGIAPTMSSANPTGCYNVGYTIAPSWFCYSPCKNNTAEAVVMVAKGIPANCPMSSESEYYMWYRRVCELIGVRFCRSACEDNLCDTSGTGGAVLDSFLGITAPLSPRIVIHPSCCSFASHMCQLFPYPNRISISLKSTLIVEGDVVIEDLHLDGSLKCVACPGTRLIVRSSCANGWHCENAGHACRSIPELVGNGHAEIAAQEVIKIRGYAVQCVEEMTVITPPPDRAAAVDTVYVFDGMSLVQQI